MSAETPCTTTLITPPALTTSLDTTAVAACTAAATNLGFRCRSRLHFFKREKEPTLLLSLFFLSSRKKDLCIVFGILNLSAYGNRRFCS